VLLYKPFIFEDLGKNILEMLELLLNVIENKVFNFEDNHLTDTIKDLLILLKNIQKCQSMIE
jgi:hypothetical protein